jgi:hypothetical protein
LLDSIEAIAALDWNCEKDNGYFSVRWELVLRLFPFHPFHQHVIDSLQGRSRPATAKPGPALAVFPLGIDLIARSIA